MNKVIGTGLKKPNSTNYGDDPLAMIQKQQVGQQRLKQRDTVREKTTNRRDDGSWSRLSHGEDRDNHKPRYHPHSLNSSRGHKHHHSRERHNRHSSSDGRRPHRPREEERSREDSFSLRQRDPRDSHSKENDHQQDKHGPHTYASSYYASIMLSHNPQPLRLCFFFFFFLI